MLAPLVLFSTIIINEPLLEKAKKLPNSGIIQQQGTYAFLKIDDAFIHDLYELLIHDGMMQKPDYFSPEKLFAGAHITIAYQEENKTLSCDDINIHHQFSIQNLSHVRLGPKEYFVLMVSAPSLEQLREKYGLPRKPYYKNIPIDFHITISIRS